MMRARGRPRRVRAGVLAYLLVVVFTLAALVYATSVSDGSYVEVFDGEGGTATVDVSAEPLVFWLGVVLIGLLLLGLAWVIFVSFRKRHRISGVIGVLGLVFIALLSWDIQGADGEVTLRWATLGPVLLLAVLLPLMGAMRAAHPRSRWALNSPGNANGPRSRRR